ncbi:MAG: helix-turn-helix domain-containing protein [Clostridiales bacterium]|nr:helix-turn-helix domain-containing protein [Clostridiales bacterium]HBM81171.1 transcriptional regulator [Clostridiaceae bacterium]
MEILSLGEKIKLKRKEKNMTLKDLAGDKVTPGQISLVESGKSKPSIDLLEYIANKIDVSIDYILETEEHQADNLCKYYADIAYASIMNSSYKQALDALNMGMAYAKDYDREYYIGLYNLYYGMIDYKQENYENAQSEFMSASEVFLKTCKYKDLLETYMQLGMTAFKLSYFNSSLNYYKQAEKVMNNNKIVDDELLMNIYFNISLCYSRLENYSPSIDYALLSMEKLKKTTDRFQYSQSLLMLSLSYNSANKFDEALKYAQKAVDVLKELNKLNLIAKMETNMGIILSNIGSIGESFKHLQNAYKIESDIDDKMLPYTMLRIADNYLKVNDFDKAIEIVKKAYAKCCNTGQDEYMVAIYYYFYKIYCLKDDKKNAEISLLEAIGYLQNLDMPKELANVYIMLGEFYQKEKKQSEALEYLNKGLKIYKELGIVSSASINL